MFSSSLEVNHWKPCMCHREASPGRLPSKNWPCHILVALQHRLRWASPECTGPPRGRRPKEGSKAFERGMLGRGMLGLRAVLDVLLSPPFNLRPQGTRTRWSMAAFSGLPGHSLPSGEKRVNTRLSAGVLLGLGAGMCGQKTQWNGIFTAAGSGCEGSAYPWLTVWLRGQCSPAMPGG